jgi:membrane dipeptidase
MERLGMLVDLAHSNDRTFADAIRFAEKPLIDSHTNCRAIADYGRCCTDDQLRALGKQGGVIGVHFGFVEKTSRVADAKLMRGFYRKVRQLERRYKEPYEFLEHRMDGYEWPLCLGGAVDDGTPIHRAKLSQLGDHIERMGKVAGIDHVCIGSDYSSGAMPEGVETAETLVNLTRELARRGFTANEIKQIWGGNFVRLLRQTLPR